MREIDYMAIEAAANDQKLDSFIKRNEAYIIRYAKTARRYLTKSDDECSLALLAFAEAVRSYDLEKGAFTIGHYGRQYA